jgi:hypothetical protein
MKTLLNFAVVAVFPAMILSACATPTPVPTPTPTIYTCQTYCDHAVGMGCDFAQATPAGAGCVAVCQNVQDRLATWDLACRSTAETCERINACERKGQFYNARPVNRAP